MANSASRTSSVLMDTQTGVETFTPDPRIWENSSIPLSLFLLQNQAQYVGAPGEDPWFAAMERHYFPLDTFGDPINGSSNVTYYMSTIPGSVLGCIEQAQFWYV